MTDYEKLYQQDCNVCGDPFPEFVKFFKELDQNDLHVLDLGCGQGRDALFIARMGHRVFGVDISPTGVQQMIEIASNEGLSVEGVAADIVDFESDQRFDIVLLDRVLHMFSGDEDKITVLTNSWNLTRQGGFVLIADTPKQKQMLTEFFDQRKSELCIVKNTKGFLFVERTQWYEREHPDG